MLTHQSVQNKSDLPYDVINVRSILELSLFLHEIEQFEDLWNVVALTLMGKLKLSAVVVSNTMAKGGIVYRKGREELCSLIAEQLQQYPDVQTQNARIVVLPSLSGEFCVGGYRYTSAELTVSEQLYSRLVLSIAEHAYHQLQQRKQLQSYSENLQRKNQLLLEFLDITKAFVRQWRLEDIEHLLRLTLRGRFPASGFAYAAWDGDECLFFYSNISGNGLNRQRCLTLWQEGRFSSVVSQKLDLVGLGVRWGEEGKFLLLYQDNEIGGEEMQREKAWFLEALLTILCITLERYRHIQEELRRKVLEQELQIAKKIQQQLFPGNVLLPSPYQFHAVNIPSRTVGGDFYDVIRLRDGRFLFVIADVSGKGVPAALLMANFQAAVRILTLEKNTVREIVKYLNQHCTLHTAPEQFITAHFLLLDTITGKAESLNAGHFPPVLLSSDGSVSQCEVGGTPLGIFADASYESEVIDLQSSLLFCAYTDGVVEATNSEGQQFGLDGLLQLLQGNMNLPLDELSTMLLRKLTQHAGSQFQDDCTFYFIRAT